MRRRPCSSPPWPSPPLRLCRRVPPPAPRRASNGPRRNPPSHGHAYKSLALSRPYPHLGSHVPAGLPGMALWALSRSLTFSGVSFLSRCSSRATVPETNGHAMLVPCMTRFHESTRMSGVTAECDDSEQVITEPGAVTSGFWVPLRSGPSLEKSEMSLSFSHVSWLPPVMSSHSVRVV